MVSDKQIKAARSLIGWSQQKLANAAELSLPTVKRFEAANGANVTDKAIRKMQTALELAGVDFIPENGGGAGVRLRSSNQRN